MAFIQFRRWAHCVLLVSTLNFTITQLVLAQELDLIEINGHRVYWPGKTERGDYFPAVQNSHFQRIMPNNISKGTLSGGLSFEPGFLVELGLMLESPTPSEVSHLLHRFQHQIDQNEFLQDSLKLALRDKEFFRMLESFFMDQGHLVAGSTGYYSRPQGEWSKPSIIVFGSPASVTSGAGHLSLNRVLLNANVIFHELLHYALDKIDHYTSETPGWDDHASFEPVETRFRIVQTIKAGHSPLLASSTVGRALDRYYGDDPSLRITHPHLGYYHQENPSPELLDEVGDFLQRPDFDKKYVEAAMVWNLMSSQRYPDCPPERMIYQDDDLRDLAYAHALNARLMMDAIQLAKTLGRDYGLPTFKIYPSQEFQRRFDLYRKALAQTQQAATPMGLKMAGQQALRLAIETDPLEQSFISPEI